MPSGPTGFKSRDCLSVATTTSVASANHDTGHPESICEWTNYILNIHTAGLSPKTHNCDQHLCLRLSSGNGRTFVITSSSGAIFSPEEFPWPDNFRISSCNAPARL